MRGIKSLMPEAVALAMYWPCCVLDGLVVLNRPEIGQSEDYYDGPFMVYQPTYLLSPNLMPLE